MQKILASDLAPILREFANGIRSEFEIAISSWDIDLRQEVVHAVIGGLLARQCVLAHEFALQPHLWNFSVGPLFVRSMVELYINFSWILLDPVVRGREFQLYGLGQAKLALEYARSLQELLEEKSAHIKAEELWLNSQRHEIFTDVNVGMWSGKPLKDMAAEAGIPDSALLYSTLTGPSHGTWDHIFQIYLDDASSPNGKPAVPSQELKLDLLFTAARVLRQTFSKFHQFTKQADTSAAYELLLKKLDSLETVDENG